MSDPKEFVAGIDSDAAARSKARSIRYAATSAQVKVVSEERCRPSRRSSSVQRSQSSCSRSRWCWLAFL